MANERRIRLIQVAKEFNVGINTITDFLQKKGVKSDGSPNALVDAETYALLEKEFGAGRAVNSERVNIRERIDPVGACVGMKGSRIYSIVKELRNENIDVVNYTANPTLMIQRSLNPAKVSSITIDEEKMTASVYLKPDQVSLAIGKGGLNIRLSKMLTGYDIDVYREVEEEDVALTEFADEIDGWVIDALKAAGCDTAKSVLELPVEEIAARADLELEQAQKVVEILKAEFE